MKSWQIVLVGIVFQLFFGIFLFKNPLIYKGIGGLIVGIALMVLAIYLFAALLLAVIPLLLLFFDRTRTIGAILSILLGLFGIIIKAGIVIGTFLLFAGIYALWKKK
ncbi:hypothetical protein HY485_00065 [Candidatus Woesearchaeota archaeon]|nr:hypothetical protein [Candidatus Woesearchaeota archaeon]